jgi:hypothetical protein
MTTYNFTTFSTAIQAKLNTASVNLSAQDYLLLAKAVQTAISTENGVDLLNLVGSVNGVASLDSSGKVPLSQLPSQLPSQTGNSGKLLTTDGSSSSWTNTATLSSVTLSGNLVAGGTIASGPSATTFIDSLTSPAAAFVITGGADSYGQVAFKNTAATSSTDIIAYSNNGSDSAGWIDMGITGSSFNSATYGITGPNDGYIFMQAPGGLIGTITNKSLTSNVATLTVASHQLSVGNSVIISGVDSTFNGTYVVTAVSSTTFSYAKVASNVTSTASSGTFVAANAGDGNLVIATGANGTNNHIVFAAGGYDSGNTQMIIVPDENVHIEIPTPSTSPTTGALTVVGGVGISGDMNIQGDVDIQGTITFGGAGTTVETANLSVTDPLVFVGAANAADIVDLGLVGEYKVGASTKYAGIVRDASDGVIKTFKDASTKPTSSVNFAEAGLAYADMRIAGLTASSITVGSVSNTEFSYLAGVTSAIQTQINSKAPTSSPTFTGTITTGFTTAGYIKTDSSGVLSSVTTIPNNALANSSIIINGSTVSLGGSVTIVGESFHPFLLMGA